MSHSFPRTNSPGSLRLRTCYGHPGTRDDCLQRCDARSRGNRSRQRLRSCGERRLVERAAKRVTIFQPEFREDLRFWIKTDPSTALRVLDLAEAVMRDPFQGPGKPEPLRYLLAGCWSRRITQEHRLVYRVTDEAVDFLQARYHY